MRWGPLATPLLRGLNDSMLSGLRVCWDGSTLVGVGVGGSEVFGEAPGVGLARAPGSGLQ